MSGITNVRQGASKDSSVGVTFLGMQGSSEEPIARLLEIRTDSYEAIIARIEELSRQVQELSAKINQKRSFWQRLKELFG